MKTIKKNTLWINSHKKSILISCSKEQPHNHNDHPNTLFSQVIFPLIPYRYCGKVNKKGKNMLRLVKNLSENFINNMKWYDVSLLKLTVMIFTLLVAKYFSILLNAQWYWYVLLLLVLAPRLYYIAFKKVQ